MFDYPKFITDATLEKLAKWLRIVGYDTEVFHKEAGREMLRLAQIEGRIVLTRRSDMTERQFSGCLYLIAGKDISSQLNDVISKFSLKIKKQNMFGICLRCNKKLYSIPAEEVRNLVPPYVFENCASFNQCPSCHNIFWKGTHQRNTLQFLEKHINNFHIK
jgi:uncharacterized protein with PIN domain